MQRARIAIGFVLVLGGCAQLYEPKPVSSPVQDETIISRTAALSHTYVLDKDTKFVTCAEPAPDASFSQGESSGFALSFLNFGGTPSSGEQAEDSDEVELTGRTPGVLMTRELFFRLCEFSRNYDLTKEEAKALYVQTLQTVSGGWNNEIGNTSIKIGETASHVINQVVSEDATKAGPPASSDNTAGTSSNTNDFITSFTDNPSGTDGTSGTSNGTGTDNGTGTGGTGTGSSTIPF